MGRRFVIAWQRLARGENVPAEDEYARIAGRAATTSELQSTPKSGANKYRVQGDCAENDRNPIVDGKMAIAPP
jgi:hypothetical protein